MHESILVGQGDHFSSLPREQWERHLAQVPEHGKKRLSFMSKTHHLIRNYVVRTLPRAGKPINPADIAVDLDLNMEAVAGILDELEQELFFLVRNRRGAVSWAFPVTVETTPHHMTFESGEQVFAAWAEDAMATPFVQGRLRNQLLKIDIRTKCEHCDATIHFSVDSQMRHVIHTAGAEPLVFQPHINWEEFSEANIIHAYWRNSVFFWSEEHARDYRRQAKQVTGIYLTLDQCAYATPIAQGALFGFWIS